MKNTIETKHAQSGSLSEMTVHDAKPLLNRPMTITVKAIKSPADDITVQMQYVDPSVQTKESKKLGVAYSLRLEEDLEAAIDTLCAENGLHKQVILRMCCRAGFESKDWNRYKSPAPAQTGAEVEPAAPNPPELPSVCLKILRHGVAENVFSHREFIAVLKAIDTLQCWWALV
jgi:hypothetical protein